jgi:cleavage and polyadenylation specificity factor subunit 1
MHTLHSSLKMPEANDFATDGLDEMDTSPNTSQPLHQILITSQSGTLALITPLSEDTYRRLSNLTTHLSNVLESACSLNTVAFRAGESGGGSGEGGWDAGTGARGMLDGNLLMRWGELSERHRRDGLGKYGEGEWMFWGEREVLAGWGIFGGRGK